jgi:hypothetical protein
MGATPHQVPSQRWGMRHGAAGGSVAGKVGVPATIFRFGSLTWPHAEREADMVRRSARLIWVIPTILACALVVGCGKKETRERSSTDTLAVEDTLSVVNDSSEEGSNLGVRLGPRLGGPSSTGTGGGVGVRPQNAPSEPRLEMPATKHTQGSK